MTVNHTEREFENHRNGQMSVPAIRADLEEHFIKDEHLNQTRTFIDYRRD